MSEAIQETASCASRALTGEPVRDPGGRRRAVYELFVHQSAAATCAGHFISTWHVGHDRLSAVQCPDLPAGLPSPALWFGLYCGARPVAAAAWWGDLARHRRDADRTPQEGAAGGDLDGHADAHPDPWRRSRRFHPARLSAADRRPGLPVPARAVLGAAVGGLPAAARQGDPDLPARATAGVAQRHRWGHRRRSGVGRRALPHTAQRVRQRLRGDVPVGLPPYQRRADRLADTDAGARAANDPGEGPDRRSSARVPGPFHPGSRLPVLGDLAQTLATLPAAVARRSGSSLLRRPFRSSS